MDDMSDDPHKEYEDLKRRFRTTTIEDLQSGNWFAELVRWVLSNYARRVDADYMRRKFPGAGPAEQARKVTVLASRYNAIAGGLSASAITGLELSSWGPQALITVPTAVAAVGADITYTTRTLLRATYDLSVIHKAPLSLDDADDCYLIFLFALGAKVPELAGGAVKAIGPKVLAYNVRSLLRTGLRSALQNALQRIGGVWLARKLTERALMRLLVPGISIPVASTFNYYFTRHFLGVADVQMRRRGTVVQPLIRLYAREPQLSKTLAPKVLIAIADLGHQEGWCEAQMDALRYCQSALSLSDEELKEFDAYFDRSLADVVKEVPGELAKGGDDLVELAVAQAALAADDHYDAAYAKGIVEIGAGCGVQLSPEAALGKVQTKRHQLRWRGDGHSWFSWFRRKGWR
jgi:hypothetical protein